MTKLSHLIFTNPHISKGEIPTKRGNNSNKEKDDEDIQDENKDYTLQKDNFRSYLQRFTEDLKSRHQKRTLHIPYHYDFIKIDFYKMYSDDLLNKKYGIEPVVYYSNNMPLSTCDHKEIRIRGAFGIRIITAASTNMQV